MFHHARVEVEQHHVITLRPRLETRRAALPWPTPQTAGYRCPFRDQNRRTGSPSSNGTDHASTSATRSSPPAEPGRAWSTGELSAQPSPVVEVSSAVTIAILRDDPHPHR